MSPTTTDEASEIALNVRFFASLREAMGCDALAVRTSATTVGQLRQELAQRSPEASTALAPQRAVRCAIDQRMCHESHHLHADAEVAFFPPVTGG